uniref:Pseudouridine synthase II N-terminal domain-containing protein n=1 Tax=Lutzomyia longipalpis TaxID=7200 RepID=A0A1B0CTM8_LUTLO
MNRPVRVYRVSGRFGKATETHFSNSRIIARSSYGHVSHGKIMGLLSSLQASHQRKMFELAGVDIQTEAAFNLAKKGTIRPASSELPVIYGITPVDFTRPNFTLEIHALNENGDYLATLVHEIGLDLRSVAHCTGIRCIRSGYFSHEQSLLRHIWTLPDIVKNLKENSVIIRENPSIFRQESSALVDIEAQNPDNSYQGQNGINVNQITEKSALDPPEQIDLQTSR